jgi:hypothetical protein
VAITAAPAAFIGMKNFAPHAQGQLQLLVLVIPIFDSPTGENEHKSELITCARYF